MFNATIVKDSVTEFGNRLTTMEWTYPRFIHAEIMTHRDRARNAASSRAIPWPKMSEKIMDDPVVPLDWPSEQRGMQGGNSIPKFMQRLAKDIWLDVRDHSVGHADMLHYIGIEFRRQYVEARDKKAFLDYHGLDHEPTDTELDSWSEIRIHKSLPNRITEPWMWITVVMTATEWTNLWRLRVHEDAEIHFQYIAGLAKKAMDESEPKLLNHGEWHLPYVDQAEIDRDNEGSIHLKPDWRQVSTARCARVSYLTHDGKREPLKDLELFEKLVTGSGFGHWSPHEHVATPATPDVRSGPYKGWLQYRKFFPGECG